MKNQNRSQVGIGSIILTIIGVAMAALDEIEIGLTLIFIATLFSVGIFLKNRLQEIGADLWALGSTIVWMGYFLFALPVFAFAWGFFTNAIYVIFLLIGLSLMVVGFTTEFFDLNEKFLRILENSKKGALVILSTLRNKIFHSPFSIAAMTFFSLFVISFWSTAVLFPLSSLPWGGNGQRFIYLILAGISLGIELRELIKLGVITLVPLVILFGKGVIRRIIKLRGLLISFVVFLVDVVDRIVGFIKRILSITIQNTFLLGIISTLTFAIIAFTRKDSELGLISLLIFASTLIALLYQQPGIISSGVSRLQQSSFRRSLIVRNYLTKFQFVVCPHCSAEIESKQKYCFSCSQLLPSCSVCRSTISGHEDVLKCKACEQPGHVSHLERWLEIKQICPHCRSVWTDEIQLEPEIEGSIIA